MAIAPTSGGWIMWRRCGITNSLCLAETLVDLINSSRHSTVWAAIPERVEWANFDSFRFGAKRDAASADDVTLDRMIDYFDGQAVSIASLQATCVYCYAEENPHPLHRWTFFRCLTADLDLDGEKYLLNAGKWYRVSREFVAEVDEECIALGGRIDFNDADLGRRI